MKAGRSTGCGRQGLDISDKGVRHDGYRRDGLSYFEREMGDRFNSDDLKSVSEGYTNHDYQESIHELICLLK